MCSSVGERVHACAVGRQQTRTSAVQDGFYAEQGLVRAVRVTADVLVFGIADPAAVNILTDLIERILIGLCQLFALEVVECVITGRFCGDVGIAVLTYIQRMRLDAMRLPPAIIVYEVLSSIVATKRSPMLSEIYIFL